LQDERLLNYFGLKQLIEGPGPVLPFCLESCYLLVYGIAATGVGILYATDKRRLVDNFYLFYFSATLGAYALFPYFPTEPPRFLFPDVAPPTVVTAMRLCNLYLLRKATIHVSVFPSAHVSSAFSAAWALLYLLPKRPTIGLLFVAYGLSVAIATVYGRYHYTADAVAGFLLSCVAFALCCWYLKVNGERVTMQARDAIDVTASENLHR
jgi:membrane-associated phospholipid phosphatase